MRTIFIFFSTAFLFFQSTGQVACEFNIFGAFNQISEDSELNAANDFYWVCEGVTVDVLSSEAGTFFLEENCTVNFIQASLGCDVVYAKDGCTITNTSDGCVGIGANPATVEVSNTGPGSATITLICSSMTYNYMGITPGSCMGIVSGIEEFKINDLRVYPNPSNGILNLEMDFDVSQNLALHVFDTQGRKLKSFDFGRLNGTVEEQINLIGLKPGSYFLRFLSEEKSLSKRLILH